MEHTFFDAPMRWQIVPWADAGMVFGAGDLETSSADVFPVHPGGGAGVRVIYDDAFVGRVDTGFGLDPVESLSGNIRYEGTWGMYVVFDHIF